LVVDFDSATRGRIRRLLEAHNVSYRTSDETGWNYDTDLLEDLRISLCDLYGTDALLGRKAERVPGFVERATGEQVLDGLELFEAPNGATFASQLNEILTEEDSRWRMLAGEMMLLDEAFDRSRLAARADLSIAQAEFSGASAELRKARNRLVDGDARDAVHLAGSSLESVMMALLDADRGKAGKLLQSLGREGFFDGLPKELRQPFIREVMEALPWMRNELGAHGQGGTEIDIPTPFGELATDLASAFCYFLISLKLEGEGRATPDPAPPSQGATSQDPQEPYGAREELDFSLATSPEDEIPF
jgi:hypothetical protein